MIEPILEAWPGQSTIEPKQSAAVNEYALRIAGESKNRDVKMSLAKERTKSIRIKNKCQTKLLMEL